MSGLGSRRAVTQAVVVVPARDEEELLPGCLAALARATDQVPVPVLVVVVLDCCGDGTAQAAEQAGVLAVPSTAGQVGAARALGVAAAAAALGPDLDPDRTWLVSTDADSRVPVGWLAHHLALADDSADLVVGTVVLDGTGDPQRHDAWTTRYQHVATTRPHPHVHGANLGVRWSAYWTAGGFAPLPAHEDVALVRTVLATGALIVRTLGAPVRTSSRLLGRTPAGVAHDLAALVGGDP